MNINSVVSLPGAAELPLETPPRDDAHAGVRSSSRPQPKAHTAFVPVLLCALALLLALGWQTYLLATERDSLQAAHFGQQQTVDNAGKLRTSLEALAADTQRVADAGNPSARVLIEELRKRGITINSAAGTTAPAAAANKPAGG